MFKLLKFVGFTLMGVTTALLLAWIFFNEAEPQGSSGVEADDLAREMMQSVNKPAWDSIKIIQWTYRDTRTLQWLKKDHLCQISWDDYLVKLNINEIEGKAYHMGVLLEADAAREIIQQAWDYFNNDSFWLNPVVKAFDPGTSRSLVSLKDGSKGLKIHYSTGGSTPGDSYLWILDETQRPKAWKMWVNKLPLDGLEFSWEDWITLPGGAQVSTLHRFFIMELRISNVKAAESWLELGYSSNPLADLIEGKTGD